MRLDSAAIEIWRTRNVPLSESFSVDAELAIKPPACLSSTESMSEACHPSTRARGAGDSWGVWALSGGCLTFGRSLQLDDQLVDPVPEVLLQGGHRHGDACRPVGIRLARHRLYVPVQRECDRPAPLRCDAVADPHGVPTQFHVGA